QVSPLQHDRSDPLPQRRGPRLAREGDLIAGPCEVLCEKARLGALPRAFNPLKCKEKARIWPLCRHFRRTPGHGCGPAGAERSGALPSAAASSGGGHGGRRKWNELPSPTRLSSQICPPCASTASLQKVSPRPEVGFRPDFGIALNLRNTAS